MYPLTPEVPEDFRAYYEDAKKTQDRVAKKAEWENKTNKVIEFRIICTEMTTRTRPGTARPRRTARGPL